MAESKYEYGCALIRFEPSKLKDLQNQIKLKDFSYQVIRPLEVQYHTTLLYGIHHNETSVDEVVKIVKSHEYRNLEAFNLSVFNNDEYDVLKYEVKGGGVYEANSDISKLKHTNNFPDYKPHMTLAYLKPGKGEEYVKKLKNNLDINIKLTILDGVYTYPPNNKIKFNVL